MTDVIEFPDRTGRDEIWVCSCGCRSFELRSNGTSACAACFGEVDVDAGGWYDDVVDGPKWDRENPIFRDLAGGDTTEFARAHVAVAASDPSARAVVVVWENDRVTAWLNAKDQAEFSELSDLIDVYKGMVGIKVEGSE